MTPKKCSLLKLSVAAVFVCLAGAASALPKPTPTPAKAGAAKTTPAADTGTKGGMYVPGVYQGWSPATAPQIAPVAGTPGLFEGYVNITGSGTGNQDFKFTDSPDWDHTNYGDGGNGTFSTDGKANDLTVPSPGYYEMTLDLNKKTWTATKTTWSIMGDATPGGWTTDTKMTYDPDKQVWTVTAEMKASGSFKFRANGAWAIDFGLNPARELEYVDNPAFTYNPKLDNLTVPSDGNYTITLDLHVPGKYTYTVEAK